MITRREGYHVYEQHGKRYLDGLSGQFTVQVGHGGHKAEGRSRLDSVKPRHKESCQMKRSIAIAAGLAATLALVACGDDDEGGSGSAEDYCTLMGGFGEKYDVLDATLSSSDSSPADAEAAMNDVKSIIAQLRSVAPAEIKADVELMSTASLRMFEIIAEYDYDEMVADTAPESAEISELFNSAEFEAASDRLSDYEDATCGLATES